MKETTAVKLRLIGLLYFWIRGIYNRKTESLYLEHLHFPSRIDTTSKHFYKLENARQLVFDRRDKLVELGPIDGLFAVLLEQVVALREVPAAQEATMGREGRGVNRLEEVMLFCVNH